MTLGPCLAAETPDRFARASDPAGALWRPEGPATTLLVETDPEPAPLADIAKHRNMAVLSAASDLDADALRAAIKRLRRALGVKLVIGHGGGAKAAALLGAAQNFDALLLHDPQPPAPTESHAFVIETFGSHVWWRATPQGAIPEPKRGRVFFLAGIAARGDAKNCAAPVNDRSPAPAQRALLVALDDYLTKGTPPPAARPPTLVPARDLRWPASLPAPPFADDRQVPAIDADGNETSGLRLPDQALPIASFTGWNASKDKDGRPCAAGAAVPFPRSPEQRKQSGDSRASLLERYGSRAYFVATMRAVADKLVKERLILKEDADAYVAAAKQAPF